MLNRRFTCLAGAVALLSLPPAGFADAASDIGDCGAPSTPIHEIQGAGRSSPLVGRAGVVVEAIVVGDFQGFPAGLGGFFLQEEDSDFDANPATSEGLFVFDAGSGAVVSEGDVVRVRGAVREFFGLTELAVLDALIHCDAQARPSTAALRLPIAGIEEWERWEGMLVRIEQPLVATGSFGLQRFGELTLAAGERLHAPTQLAAPGSEAVARLEDNERRRILLDDGSALRNPPPPATIVRPDSAGGGTLRLGDITHALEGVLHFSFGRFRIQPTAPVAFESFGERSEGPPAVGGRLQVAGWNVENAFNGDGRGNRFPTRGAASFSEWERQRAKLVETIARLDAGVVGLVEVENDGVGPDSVVREIADALALRGAGLTYELVDPGAGALGTHAISVALLYRPAEVEPIGQPAVLDSRAHAGFDSARNRPSLAQSFRHRATNEHFTIVVNHFKSKGSECDSSGDPDLGDGQGNCNATRRRAAQALGEWLATDPTGADNPMAILIGDWNAYPREDPLETLAEAGYVELIDWFVGPDATSFEFDGMAGRLDHALVRADGLPKVAHAAVWNTNSVELPLLDYRKDNPAGLYVPGPFRASDHDPVLVGLFPNANADGVDDERDRCSSAGPGETATRGSSSPEIPRVQSASSGRRHHHRRHRACRWPRSRAGCARPCRSHRVHAEQRPLRSSLPSRRMRSRADDPSRDP